MFTIQQLVLITVVMILAAGLQGSFGFGSGLLANPILALIDPGFIGVPMLICAVFLSIMVIVRERGTIELKGIGWAIVGRVLGTAAGAWLLTRMSQDTLTIVFSGMVLLGVLITVAKTSISVTRGSLLSMSVLSGIMGTVASIGGPPVALLFQRVRGCEMRPTLAMLLMTGNLISITGLGIIGRFGYAELVMGLVLIPGMVLGFFFSSRLLQRIAPATLRAGVLTISTISALAALIPYIL